MGVSFKVTRAGTRYRRKTLLIDDKDEGFKEKPLILEDNDGYDKGNGSKQSSDEGDFTGVRDIIADLLNSLGHRLSQDHDLSFSLNLFHDGFSVGKATEEKLTPLLHDVPKHLYPYDAASEKLFSAIEYGCLPGDAFDNIPCKYVNGVLVCEIRDYRNCTCQQRDIISSDENSPVVHKVHLRMCMENVIKDIPSISDDSWTYNDLLEVESRILKALQPELHLNPVPLLDRFYGTRLRKKLNLGISRGWRKGKQSSATVANLVHKNLFHGNQISNNDVSKNFKAPTFQNRGVPFVQQPVVSCFSSSQHNNNAQEAVEQSFLVGAQPKHLVGINGDRSASTTDISPSFVCVPEENLSHAKGSLRSPATLLLGKRGRSGTPVPGLNIKKPKQEQLNLAQQQLAGTRTEPICGPDLKFKRIKVEHIEAEEAQAARTSIEKHTRMFMNNDAQAILDGTPKLQVATSSYQECGKVQYTMTEQHQSYKVEVGQNNDYHHTTDLRTQYINLQQSQFQQLQSPVRANVPTPLQWNHTGQPVCNNLKTVDARQKRRLTQSPRVSARRITHSPVSSQSGNVSSFSMGVPCCKASSVYLYKEKATSMSILGDGTASVDSIQNNVLLKKASLPTKSKSNSLKTSRMKGVGSYSSNTSTNAVNAKGPLVGIPSLPMPSGTIGDPVLERFSKIDLVTKKYALNRKKQKFDQCLQRKRFPHIPTRPAVHLLDSEDKTLKDAITDKMSLSKCLLSRNLNVSTSRTLTFVRQVWAYKGNRIPIVVCEAQIRLVMLVKPKDGMVEAYVLHDYAEEIDSIKSQQYLLPTLPNVHRADVFAAQFTLLMVHEGYRLTDDQIQPTSLCCNGACSKQQPCVMTSAIPVIGAAELPSPSTILGLLSSYMLSPIGSSIPARTLQQSPSQNILAEACLLSRGHIQAALQLSVGHFSEPQQMDIVAHLASMQQPQMQQQRQIQIPSFFIGNNVNPLSNTNQHVVNQRTSYPTHLEIQLQQRQRQLHQQQSLMQRKKIVGGLEPAISMGSMHTSSGGKAQGNLVRPGNVSNINNGRTILSTVGGHFPGLGNASHVNDLQGYFSSSGSLPERLLSDPLPDPPSEVVSKLRVAQCQGGSMVNEASNPGNFVDGVGAMTGNSLVHKSSLLSRATSSSMAKLQHADMVDMNSQKTSEIAFNRNQQQLQPQIQQQQQQQLAQLRQMGSSKKHPQATSLAEHVCSPPAHVSLQQISQQTQLSPKQMSSGSVQQQENAGNFAVGPDSLQLSSQTHGSISSITSSPMELPGVSGGTDIHNWCGPGRMTIKGTGGISTNR